MITAKPLLGQFDQAFQFIQEFTGFFTPGIVVLFILGLFWKRTTAKAALAAALGSFIMSWGFKVIWLALPFMDRVGIVFIACTALAVVISLMSKQKEHVEIVDIKEIDFSTSKSFNMATIATVLILIAFYWTWW